jgi:endoglycosylceramidase
MTRAAAGVFFRVVPLALAAGCGSGSRSHSATSSAPVAAATEPTPSAAGAPLVHVSGTNLVDPQGRILMFRGVNVAGNSKVPPFLPFQGDAPLDTIAAEGLNAMRLVFVWEAYEPVQGQYSADYLQAMLTIAQDAYARGIHTVVDFHQDGYARFLASGCGDGFPQWAVSQDSTQSTPDNGPDCSDWATKVALDPSMHQSFHDFYADTYGVRTAFLSMVSSVSQAFSAVPGVLGYDLLNEPWGYESSELEPLYEDEAVAIRAQHPSAILFVEGQITTNAGLDTGLPQPQFDNYVYAPHFYDPIALSTHSWSGSTLVTDNAFATMTSRAQAWGVPLFLGEYGMHADATNAAGYMNMLYAHLDNGLLSAMQWNYTPGWTPDGLDGWDAENLDILDTSSVPRANFTPRMYPAATAGTPQSFTFAVANDGTVEGTYTWTADGSGNTTDIAVPQTLVRTSVQANPLGTGVSCTFDDPGNMAHCTAPAGTAGVVVRLLQQ